MDEVIVGRAPPEGLPCVLLQDKTVSRQHARLRCLANGRIEIFDLGSTSGTFVRTAEGWRRIDSLVVESGEELRFGDYQIKASDLSARMAAACRGTLQPAGRFKVERDPETGELVRRVQ